ncbi:MAG TPA: hypothetical protein VGP33_08065 [Chloroflexota bacterium]|nr:hypothetical protein [Chloroflexota bacterium]
MLPRKHADIKRFDRELEAAGGLAGRFDAGTKVVPAGKIVGSVGRARNLRSDFFYKKWQAMTDRFLRVGKAMEKGIILPPLELYAEQYLAVGGLPSRHWGHATLSMQSPSDAVHRQSSRSGTDGLRQSDATPSSPALQARAASV